jgi:peptidoglycan L-alanyl-D-glutamate endopeptidase CwlK
MPHFGLTSRKRLDTCHKDLQAIFVEVVKGFDCAILCGHRDEVAQMLAYESGKSQLTWPDSKHNTFPSMAVDVAPWPLDWNDRGAFYMLAGYVLCTADRLRAEGRITHRLRYGGDWNGNHNTRDQKLHDLPHYELKP